MEAALHYELPQEQLHEAFNQLDQILTSRDDQKGDSGQPLSIKVANAIWADQTLPVLDQYLDVAAQNYGAGVRLADFSGSTEQARIEINSWVSQQTDKRILDLISRGALESSTRMVLVSAIYFKGD